MRTPRQSALTLKTSKGAASLEGEEESIDALLEGIARDAESAGLDLDLLHDKPLGEEKPSFALPSELDDAVCWWNAPFLTTSMDPDDLVEHVHFESRNKQHAGDVPTSCIFKTRAERKRDRRDRRLATQRDHQDMIRAGLIPAPPDCRKLSSLPRIAAAASAASSTTTLADSLTAIEVQVRREAEERRKAHEQANMQRALTPAERAAKTRSKMIQRGRKDPDGSIHGLVMLLHPLSPKEQFKIVANARQRYLVGLFLARIPLLQNHEDGSGRPAETDAAAVIAEGSQEALGHLQRLVQERMGLSAEVLWQGPLPASSPSLLRTPSFATFEHWPEWRGKHVLVAFLMDPVKRGMFLLGSSSSGKQSATQDWRACASERANIEHYWHLIAAALHARTQ